MQVKYLLGVSAIYCNRLIRQLQPIINLIVSFSAGVMVLLDSFHLRSTPDQGRTHVKTIHGLLTCKQDHL